MATHVQGVLDLTFMDIGNDEDFETAYQQRISAPSPSKSSKTSTLDKTDGTAAASPLRRTRRDLIKAVRLSNNEIELFDSIVQSIALKFDVSSILWLDLSFNQITSVMVDLGVALPYLATLYLHANKISKLSDIKKLGQLQQLKSVALYGNPVEDHKHYRNYVLYTCPGLTQFDMSPVTKTERQRMEVWAQTYRRVLNPEIES